VDTGAETAVPQEGASSPGAILAAERERQGLSRADVAQRLHMSVSQVEAMELGDYEHLPRGPFLRGFVRNYARLLGLDPEALLGLLAASAPPESAPRIVVPTQNIRFDPLGTRLSNPYVKAAAIAMVAIVLGFAAMYWWLFVRPQGPAGVPARKPATTIPALPPPAVPAPVPDSSSPAPTGPVLSAPPSSPAPTGPALSAPPTGSSAAPQSVSAPPSPAAASFPEPAPIRQAAMAPAALPSATAAPAAPSPAKPAAATAVPPAAVAGSGAPAGAAGGSLIRMNFRGPAWVEVKDAQGRVLLSRTQPRGSDAEVEGKPPFSLVIGNAADVRLVYNGREVDLEPHTRVSVARLTLP
jgi:cytoskeleton protein RodZ